MSEIFLDAIRLIIAAGVLIAALIGKFITNNLGRNVLRCLAIALFRTIVLRYMGLADSIINLAFRVGHDGPVGGPEGSDPVTACQLTTWHEERAGRGIAPGPHLPRSPICWQR